MFLRIAVVSLSVAYVRHLKKGPAFFIYLSIVSAQKQVFS
ncbi:hypothetical protein CP082626L3_0453 [Chlamydia psittaci 08-2626_L3]|nr:hypothetical protein CP09DC78_0681 [Chlamydia psittaci 09DC78]EPP29504.1 hypothetical protein CP082626L3_0453 [Chlamydia psittaci 08-2626_L3]EPP32201.1 hypothetical protein CPC197_0337 [Chlamydia psittaci C1/97]KXH24836.1 hypothetical protein P059_03435 [Chlamydia psittaci UGA]